MVISLPNGASVKLVMSYKHLAPNGAKTAQAT